MIVADSIVTAWLRSARTGDRLVYARATCLPVNCMVGKRMRDLAVTGQVLLRQERRTHGAGNENFRYVAQRTAKPLPDSPAGIAKGGAFIVKSIKPLLPQDRRVTSHALIVREIAPQVRAMLAEGMPRNACAIAQALGLYSQSPVQAVLQRMAA